MNNYHANENNNLKYRLILTLVLGMGLIFAIDTIQFDDELDANQAITAQEETAYEDITLLHEKKCIGRYTG